MSLAKANIFEFICERGRATRVDVYTAFSLVSKRVVDTALEELVTERRLVAGDTHYAPARAVPKTVEAVPPPPPPPTPPKAPPPPSTRKRLAALFARQHSWTPDEIYTALAPAKESSVYTELCAMVRKKLLFRDGAVYTTLKPKVPPKPSNPSDASEAPRTPEATGTSKKPAAVATPTPVADEHDASAQTLESPPPAMGPVEACDIPRSTDMTAAILDDTHALDQEPTSMPQEPESPKDDAQASAPTAAARVLVELPDLTIEVRGTASAVRAALNAIDFETACFDGAR